MCSFVQDTLSRQRVQELNLKKVYERRYRGKTANRRTNGQTNRDSKKTYLYEFCFSVKSSENTNESNIVEHIENNDPDVATMISYSKLQFTGCQMLGLIAESLTMTKGKTNTPEESEETSPDHIEVSSDVVNNTIDIKYFIVGSCDDLEIRFKIMMKSELSISMIEKRNVKIDPEAHTFHRNGYTIENDLCSVLHKGFRISSIRNQPESKFTEIQTTDLNNNFISLDDHDSFSLGFPTIMAGSSRKKTSKRKLPTFLSSFISSQMSNETGRSIHGEKILIFIEYLSHPTFMIFMDLGRKVKFLKQTVKKTLEKLNYHPHDTKDIRLIFNANSIIDEKTLSETFGNLQAVRCSMVTTKPYLAPAIALRTAPESQIQSETLHRFKSCWILFRNVHACNRAAEVFLNATERIRFNESTVAVAGIVYSEDLGKLIIIIADELKRLSTNLLKLSNTMVKDENLVQGSDEYEKYKCMIQNLMDAARYAGPLFQALSKFTIPLTQSSPRAISIVQQR